MEAILTPLSCLSLTNRLLLTAIFIYIFAIFVPNINYMIDSPKREKTDCQYNLQYAVNYINYEESNVRKGNVIRSVKEYVSL